MYYCYILHSEKIDKYYIGSTNNVEERLRRHNTSNKGFTSTGRPWEVVYVEEFEEKGEALAREKQLKKWKSKVAIESLLKGA